MSKANNLLAILWLLKSRKRLTGKEFAEILDMNIRTIDRCLMYKRSSYYCRNQVIMVGNYCGMTKPL